MADYRVYFLSDSGSILRRLDVDCSDDRGACQIGEDALQTSPSRFSGVEVWQCERFVERLERKHDNLDCGRQDGEAP